MKKKVLTEIFDNLEKSLYSDMSIRIENNLEDGMYREYLVKKVLEKIVPSKYCITDGFIIDSDNNISKQMDIIIYDKNYVPPFFDETYTVVPIEAVIAVIQVKTTINNKSLEDSRDNLNSINHLNSKIGGQVISASDGRIIEEKRYIMPYKIIVAYRTDKSENYDYAAYLNDVDMLYIVEDKAPLYIKDRKEPDAVVNVDKDELLKAQTEYSLRKIEEHRLANFALSLLEKMKLINNSIIINYQEYIKGAME